MLTSYRPIALTSMLVNLLKTMWLQRLVSVVDKHLSHCWGEFDSELTLGWRSSVASNSGIEFLADPAIVTT